MSRRCRIIKSADLPDYAPPDPEQLRERWVEIGVPDWIIDKHVKALRQQQLKRIVLELKAEKKQQAERQRQAEFEREAQEALEDEPEAVVEKLLRGEQVYSGSLAKKRNDRKPDKTRKPSDAPNLTGKRFGDWKVIRYHDNQDGHLRYLCRCECGEKEAVRINALTSGRSKHCSRCTAKAYLQHRRKASHCIA